MLIFLMIHSFFIIPHVGIMNKINTFEAIMGDNLHVIVNNSSVCICICYLAYIYRFF